MPFIKCLHGALQGQEYPLGGSPVSIGRDASCVINAKDPKLSRNHAAIVLKDSRCVIRDNKSSNGTFINGIRIPALETHVLFPGDDIRTGHLLLRYLAGELRLTESAIPGFTIHGLFAEDETTASFHAREEGTGRDVALVVLRPALLPDAKARSAFRDEAEAGAMLDHPNIVPVFDFVNDSARLYYTRAWVPSPPLTFAMCAETSPKAVTAIALQLAQALNHAHEKGVFHGCLHPSWIHLSGDGQILVRGFGTSVRAETLQERLSCFLTPEQIGHRPVDGRTDLYALGAVLYQLLCGKPVYSGLTPEELQSKILHDAPDPLTRHVPDCPAPLNDIILTLLQRDPSNRYQTAEELLDALQRHHSGKPAPKAGQESGTDDTTSTPPVAGDTPPTQNNANPSAPRPTNTIRPIKRRTPTSRNTRTSSTSIGGTHPASPTSAVPKGKRDDTLLIIGIATAVLLVAGVVGVGALLRRGGQTETPNGVEEPRMLAVQRDTLEREAREALEAGDETNARAIYVELVNAFPQDELLQVRARGIIDRIDRARQREARQTEFRRRMDAYHARREEDPGAATELQGVLSSLQEEFPEFSSEIDAASQQLVTAQGDLVLTLRNDVRILLRDGQIDRAFNRIDQFAAAHPDHPQIDEAKVQRELVQETFDRLSAQYRERIQAQIQANVFGRALEIMAEMKERFQHAETLQRIAVDERQIHTHLQRLFTAMEDQLRILLGQRAYAEAYNLLQKHRPAFYGTRHEDGVAKLTQAVNGADRLQMSVIETITRHGGRPVPDNFNMPQIQPLRDQGGTLTIQSANVESIRIQSRNSSVRIPWSELSRPQLLAVYDLFPPPAGTPEHDTLTVLRPLLQR